MSCMICLLPTTTSTKFLNSVEEKDACFREEWVVCGFTGSLYPNYIVGR